MPVSAPDVLRRRLATQHLLGGARSASATDVVSLLACVQSQEYAHGLWSLGMRTAGLTFADVRREFDAGTFVSTHILRPTWHFVAAADLQWMQAVTAPRVLQRNRSICRRLQLDDRDLERGSELVVAALQGGRHLTRRELGRVLEDAGMSAAGERLAYIVMTAELQGLICSGPLRGAQHTYAVAAERLPDVAAWEADAALVELAWRYFAGHGPSTVQDLARWASLTIGDARKATELAAHRLQRLVVDDLELWFDPAAREPVADIGKALLLPLYDEVLLSYPALNFPVAADHPHEPGTDLFVGSVVVDAVNVGLWRRTVRGRTVEVETRLAPGLGAGQRAAVADAASRLAAFLQKELLVVAAA